MLLHSEAYNIVGRQGKRLIFGSTKTDRWSGITHFLGGNQNLDYLTYALDHLVMIQGSQITYDSSENVPFFQFLSFRMKDSFVIISCESKLHSNPLPIELSS